AELALTARFPAYISRPDEPILAGAEPVLLPAGTEIITSGAASVSLGTAAWSLGEGTVARLRVEGSKLEGRFTPSASGTWRLDVQAQDGAPFDWGSGAPPELHVVVVAASAPVVALPVPGRDTTLPLSLRQPLVVDVRDDHGIAR